MLTGSYWTGRETTGDIEMRFWKKQLIDSYPEELGMHPDSYPEELGMHPVSAIRDKKS